MNKEITSQSESEKLKTILGFLLTGLLLTQTISLEAYFFMLIGSVFILQHKTADQVPALK